MMVAVVVLGAHPTLGQEDAPRPIRNVLLVTTDGLRWQEVFRGADEELLNLQHGKVEDVDGLRKQFWRETPEARREALMPFLWSIIAKQGQVFGNRDRESPARAANGLNFSYPGYNELLTGFVDPSIDSNAKRPNPNVSVLEWLNRKPTFRGKVTAVGSWDVHPFILNVGRSGLLVNSGWMTAGGPSPSRGESLLNDLMKRSIHDWNDCRNDVFTFRVALEAVRHRRPKVLYVALGDTDEYAHAGRYDHYLQAAHEADAAIRTLWEEFQSHSSYRGSTALIVTTDHGRGATPESWPNHGAKVAGSEETWLGVLAPGVPALGERSSTCLVTQGQVAATLAALLGEDYRAEVPRAAEVIADVLPFGVGKPEPPKAGP
jgi:hypothetical protein